MTFYIDFRDFSQSASIDLIYEKLKSSTIEGSYHLVIEYNNQIEEHFLFDDYMMEITPDHLKFLKQCRLVCNDLSISLKNIYLLGSSHQVNENELKVSLEKTIQKEAGRNIVWPSKELYLYDGGKRVLDTMLRNDEIAFEEYEAKLKLLQMEFGLIEFLEEDFYIN